MVGAAGFGMVSDRIGRKRTLMLCIAIFSIFSGAAYFAPNFKVFVSFRFLAGLGMGGAMPIAITLVSEFAPAKIRAKAVTAMFGGFTLLFSKGLIGMTILVWLTYFFNLLVIYGLASWLPTLLVKAGLSQVKSYSYGMIQSVGASVGGFLLGWVMDKFGRKAGLSLFYFLGGIALWIFGYASSNAALLIAGAATGVFIIGTQIAQHVITGEIYPTHARSTGVGWALTIGRLGSIIGPLLGGLLQMGGFSFGQYFLIFSIPCFLCSVLVLLYKVNVKGEGLETINEKLSTPVQLSH